MAELHLQECIVRAADVEERPERAKLYCVIRIRLEHRLELFLCVIEIFSGGGAGGELHARTARKPFVETGVQAYQFGSAELCEVTGLHWLGLAVSEFKNAA